MMDEHVSHSPEEISDQANYADISSEESNPGQDARRWTFHFLVKS